MIQSFKIYGWYRYFEMDYYIFDYFILNYLLLYSMKYGIQI